MSVLQVGVETALDFELLFDLPNTFGEATVLANQQSDSDQGGQRENADNPGGPSTHIETKISGATSEDIRANLLQ